MINKLTELFGKIVLGKKLELYLNDGRKIEVYQDLNPNVKWLCLSEFREDGVCYRHNIGKDIEGLVANITAKGALFEVKKMLNSVKKEKEAINTLTF